MCDRSSSLSTTCTGPIEPRSSCWRTCSGGAPGELAAALAAAARDGHGIELAPGPLSTSEARALVGADVDAALLRDSGGNPFYLAELVRAKRRDSAITSRDAAPLEELPAAVSAALEQEIAALDPPARQLAEGAAVAGEPVELDLAIVAAGLEEPVALEALEQLLAVGLLGATGVPRRYRFRHPIVRRAVYEGAGERRRLEAHARAAAALEAHDGALAARAHHLERSARTGEVEAVPVLVAAAQEARTRAPASAAGWLRAALALLPAGERSGPPRLELLAPLAVAQSASGELAAALVTLEEALELVPPGLAAVRGRLVAACAAGENLLGRHEAAHARLLRALAELGELDPEAAGVLQAELATDALYESDFAGMGEWARRAHASASAGRDPGRLALAAALVCFAEYSRGEGGPAEAARAEASAGIDALFDGELAACLAAPYYLGFAEFFCERYEDAARHLRRGIELARATGQGQFLAPMSIGLAHALETLGRVGEGAEAADSAVEVARLQANPQIVSWALTAQAWTAAIAGDHERAKATGEEAVQNLAGLDESVLTRATRAHVAAMWLEVGDAERCLVEMEAAGAPDFSLVEPGRRSWLGSYVARAELQRGRAARAERRIAAAERWLGEVELPMAQASVLYARAELELAEGDAGAAAQRAQLAADRAEAVGAAVQAARSRTLAGRALAASGAQEAARKELGRAEAELAACGAMRLRDEAARELRKLGRRAPARARRAPGAEGLAALSGREREIAVLVADGRTNREIAGRLFLAEKTIEGHLSNVFSKLGVRSRTEVATQVGREGASPDA